ncbi:carcinoembryonic antigen-related cell adhesion molecule 20 [Oryzias melastigma]|uniref:carcinoembryonic antigen-related cell adhesion molecule 20 n=1 Tax=Oryzias melastigma TaxID=30732 RepID=UPI00168CB81D|nr:carcinoembryonic antigen-related cell adhesion molecule 20 [Oryzias melastigma]
MKSLCVLKSGSKDSLVSDTLRTEIMMRNGKSLLYTVLMVLMVCSVWGVKVQISWYGRVTAGHRTEFTCSSSCFPNCVYSWTFKGRTVNGSTLTWTPDGQDDTVELRCAVHDPGTGISSSTSSFLEISNQMSVRVSPPNTVPTLNQSLNLVCLSPGDPKGQSDLIWFKDGQKVTQRENLKFLQNNRTLHFDSVLPSDAGFYQCQTFLPSLQTRVISLGFLLSFDLWNVSIRGPDSVFPGRLSEFTCLTSCTQNVECTVRWQFGGSFPIGTFFSVNGNRIRWTPSIPGAFQNFNCVAENKAAGRSAEATKLVEVKGVPVSGSEAAKLHRLLLLISFMGFKSLI